VSFFVADQTYQWVGMKKRGRRNTVEQHDAHGMPLKITHEVYVNSIKVHLPFSLGTLTPHDLARIAANHGSPYTEDYNLVFVPLRPDSVEAYLLEFAGNALASLSTLSRRSGTHVRELSIRSIAEGLYGRPNIDVSGATEFDILDPLMNTDTKYVPLAISPPPPPR